MELFEPPRPLGEHGQALWGAIQAQYHISDAGGVEMLAQACAALDRAEQLAAAIANAGVMIGVKGNPAVKDEIACRAFVVKTLRTLGLDVESAKPIGRPVGPQWTGHNRSKKVVVPLRPWEVAR
jgi:hypothetical protein